MIKPVDGLKHLSNGVAWRKLETIAMWANFWV